jgi:hypothetical protein
MRGKDSTILGGGGKVKCKNFGVRRGGKAK